MDKEINKIYTDVQSPGGFSSAEKLYRAVKNAHPKITRKDVGEFLEKNRTHTLFRGKRNKFARSKIVPIGILEQVHCDLAEFQQLSRENAGYRYLLVAVDIFTKMAYATPVKGKEFKHMKPGFEKIFADMTHLPSNIFTDRGGEFISKEMRNYLEEQGVKLHTAASDTKACFAERMIRTIKSRLYRYFSEV